MERISSRAVHRGALWLVLALLGILAACASPSPEAVFKTTRVEAPHVAVTVTPTPISITLTPSATKALIQNEGSRVSPEKAESTPSVTPSSSATPTSTHTPYATLTPEPTAAATSDLPCPAWTWTASDSVHPDWPPFTFRVVGMDCGDFVEGHRIEVYRGEATQPSQVIEGQFVAQMLRDTGQGFEIVDMDFDGFQDIRLLDEMTWGSSGPLYRHWLFDPQTGMFVPNQDMNQSIGRAEFNAEEKQIRVHWKAGAGGYAIHYYHWIEGKLTFIREEEYLVIAEGVDLVTIREQMDGKLVESEKKIVRQKGLDAIWLVLIELGQGFGQLATAPNGDVWAISPDGLFRFDGQAWHIIDLPENLDDRVSPDGSISRTISDLAAGADGVVWVGTQGDGLFRYAEGVWDHVTQDKGLPSPAVRQLALDADGRLWAILEDQGGYLVAKFDGENWMSLSLEGVPGEPNHLAVISSGQVWLSIPGHPPHVFEEGQWSVADKGWDAGSVEMALAANPRGELWFGSDHTWVRWTEQGWQGINVPIPAPFAYPVAVDATGGAWGIVTPTCYFCGLPDFNENGAVYVTPDQSCRFTASDGLGGPPLDPAPDGLRDYTTPRPDQVWDIQVAADGRVWFITQGSITVFSPQGPICGYAIPENVRTP